MEISKNRSATARKSSEQPRQDTAKTALITPLRSLYSFIFPHQSSRHGIALFRPLGSIRALCRPISPVGLNTGYGSGYVLTALRAYAYATALFRYRSIRALCRPISPVGLNTGSGSGYVLTALRAYAYATALFRPLGSIRALVIPGLRYAYPGLYSGAPSGRSLPPRRINNARTAGVHSPSQNQQCPRRGRPFPLAIYGEGVADRPGVRSPIKN